MFKCFGGPFDPHITDNIYGEQTNARLYKAAAMVSIFSQDFMIKCFGGSFDSHLTDNIYGGQTKVIVFKAAGMVSISI